MHGLAGNARHLTKICIAAVVVVGVTGIGEFDNVVVIIHEGRLRHLCSIVDCSYCLFSRSVLHCGLRRQFRQDSGGVFI